MAEAGNVTPELMAEAVRVVAGLKRAAREEAGKVGPAVKKYEELGVNKKALMRTVKDRLRDDDEVLAENRAYLQMMAIEKHKVTAEELFGDLDLSGLGGKAAETHLLWSAEESGYAAGLGGGDDDSAKRYPAGSPAQAAWSKGHKRGAAALAAKQPEGTEVADTRKERKQKDAKAPAPAAEPEPEAASEESDGWPLEATKPAVNDDGALFDDAAPKAPARKAKAEAPPKPASVPVPPKGRGRKPGSKVASATRVH